MYYRLSCAYSLLVAVSDLREIVDAIARVRKNRLSGECVLPLTEFERGSGDFEVSSIDNS